MKKGILALGAVAGLLALPVMASGDTDAIAKRGDNFKISFTLKTFEGEPVELKRFRVRKLDAFCDGDLEIQVRGRIPSVDVNDRNRFSQTLRRGSKKLKTKGKVSGDLEKVRGFVRAWGDFGPAEQNCDSGKARWVAR